jgi:TolA-binding protein
MTTTPLPAPPASSPPAEPPKPRRWPKRLLIGGIAVAVLLVGVGIGAAGANNQDALTKAQKTVSSQRDQIGTLQGQITALQGQVSSLQSQLTGAQQTAANATKTANAKAASDYAARNAALKQGEKTLKRQQRALNQMIGQVQANQISQDGVYVVGSDIKAGTWHTPGDNGVGGDACYYAALNSTNTSDISDNNNFDGPETVTVSGGAFEISGPCTWYLVS